MSTLVRERRGALDRVLVLFGSLALVAVAREEVTPLWRRCIDPWVDSLHRGPRMLAGHLIVWTLPMAIFSGIALVFLIKTRRFQPLSITRGGRRAVVDGLLGALFAIVVALLALPLLHLRFGFAFRGWEQAGDLVSNAYEELVARGLVFTAAWYALDSRMLAALISGLLFGLTHEQYPPLLRVLVGITGAVWSLVYARTGNFAAPWIAHEGADLVLGLILVG